VALKFKYDNIHTSASMFEHGLLQRRITSYFATSVIKVVAVPAHKFQYENQHLKTIQMDSANSNR